jgi:hypothetical protein
MGTYFPPTRNITQPDIDDTDDTDEQFDTYLDQHDQEAA